MTASKRPLLVLGDFHRESRTAVALAASEAAFTPEFLNSPQTATDWLARHLPHAIVVDEASRHGETLCVEARAQSRLAQVPILAVAPELDDLSFAEVFNWGGDDAVELKESRNLVARLRSLPAERPATPSMERGRALVVDADHRSRIVLARVLRNAGFEISFGVSAEDVISRCNEADVVVVTHDVNGAPAELLDAARSRGCEALWIVRAPPRLFATQSPLMQSFDGATVTDAFAPPENIVFVANELARGGGAADARASRRLLYGTKVAFRGAGRERDDFGYCYNISLGGLYVRTLAPPSDEMVWLELRPPRVDRLVRLVGRVAWRRPFGPAGHATVPPGFGLEIVDGARSDLDAWQSGYRSFGADLGFASAA